MLNLFEKNNIKPEDVINQMDQNKKTNKKLIGSKKTNKIKVS